MGATQFVPTAIIMADAPANVPKRRTFRKYSYRGVDLDQLLDYSREQMMEMYNARQRRAFLRGTKRKHNALLKRLRKAKKAAPPLEKPEVIKTHLRNMVIEPEMIGHYLGEFSITYKPVKHGRPGIGATHSSRFIPLKKTEEHLRHICQYIRC